MSRLPWRRLRAPLGQAERRSVERLVRGLLAWQADLRRWPRLGDAPNATPFVSLYAGGRLRGCIGHAEGAPAERVARAFVRALEDDRYGRVAPSEREGLAAMVCYPRAVRSIVPVEAMKRIEPGRHGLVLLADSGPVVLLPQVARDHGLDAAGLLGALTQKAGLPADAWRRGELWVFETEAVAVRPREGRSLRALPPVAEAAAFLETLIDPRGRVAFGASGVGPELVAVGPMHHGRAAVVVEALNAVGGRGAVARRASRWLEREVSAGLAARAPAGWPEHPAAIAGTLALACRAGLPFSAELAGYVSSRPEVAEEPWHAAQVVSALGERAPSGLWKVCTRALRRAPWAPWTVMAAQRIEDAEVRQRGELALVDGFRKTRPFSGGGPPEGMPELALTAVAVEALRTASGPSAKRAIRRGRAFLLRHQLRRGAVPMPLCPTSVGGAFPISPVVSFARGDVTGHALLALAG